MRHLITNLLRHGNNIHCADCGRKVEWVESKGKYVHTAV